MSQKLKTHCQSAVTRTRRAFSLVELLAVLVILVAVAGVVLPTFGNAVSDAKRISTQESLQRVRQVIVGSPEAPGYFTHARDYPARMAYLFSDIDFAGYDPVTKTGWNGPYLLNPVVVVEKYTTIPSDQPQCFLVIAGEESTKPLDVSFNAYLQDDEVVLLDAYGNPILVQNHTVGLNRRVRLLSAGSNGVIDNLPSAAFDSDTDDLVLILRDEIGG